MVIQDEDWVTNRSLARWQRMNVAHISERILFQVVRFFWTRVASYYMVVEIESVS